MHNLVSNLVPRAYHKEGGLSSIDGAIRVVVADSATEFRDATCEVLKAFFEVEISGCAKNGFEALQLAIAYEPDLLILDANLPGLNGFATAALVTAASPLTQILMVSSDESLEQHASSPAAGSYAFTSKSELALIFANLCGPAS